MISEVRRAAASHADTFAAAYRTLRADRSIQFDLPPALAPAKPPEWLEALGRFLRHLFAPVGRFLRWIASYMPDAPFARGLLWAVIAIGAAMLVVAIVRRLREGEWTWPWRARRTAVAAESTLDTDWTPDAAPLRAWLEEADALAREQRFAAAIHCLLLRSIDDLASRRPMLARPSLTGRELARSPLVPERARGLFAGIAGTVEHSLFGRCPVDEAQWLDARRSYSEFALAGAWRT